MKTDSASTGIDLELYTKISAGLTLTVDAESSVQVVDEAGETQFFAPTPIMWDSSGQEVTAKSPASEVGSTDRTRAPAGGDVIATMPVSIAGSTIVIAPDRGILESAATEWPVYIDPGFSGLGASLRIAVRAGGYTNTLVNWTDLNGANTGQGTGNCNVVSTCTTSFRQRLAWQFSGLESIASLVGSDITAATFSVYGAHSYNCTAYTTYLYNVGPISSGTTWGNAPWGSSVSYRSEAHSASCGNRGYKDYDALASAKWVADADKPSLALGLLVDEGSMAPWKRFGTSPTLSISYNQAPTTPTGLQLTQPDISTCVSGASRPAIATTTPTLSAIASDPDGTPVSTSFSVNEVKQQGGGQAKWTSGSLPAMASGSRAAVSVPVGKLVDGGVYVWKASASDGVRSSGWSSGCEFTVDTSAPVIPTVSTVGPDQYPTVQAIYAERVERGGVGQLGLFEIGPGTSTDVISYLYGFNTQNPTTVAYPQQGYQGRAGVVYTPTTTGPVTLTVKSRDAAGNLSPARTYTFTVTAPTEDGIWTFDEGTGATAADTAGNPARPATLTGAGWTDGPHALFDSRPGDHALILDGVDDAATSAPVVDTKHSFVVSAHVWLDPSKVGQGQSYTVLGQDGASQSGFRLGYSSACAGSPAGCWSFSMPDTATGATSVTTTSTVPVTGGEWTYLVGEHDVVDHKLRLWVCEIGTPEDPAIGEPVRSEASRTATPWSASGAFTIGRGQGAGVNSGWWPGKVDNVRVFSGEVLAESKIRRLCQGAEAGDFSGVPAAIDPTSDVAE